MTAATVVELELPALCDLTGYTLVRMAQTNKGSRVVWTAIWRTPARNFMHQATPFTTDRSEADAIAYAMTCPETW